MKRLAIVTLALPLLAPAATHAASTPVRSRLGMVVSQNAIASQVGVEVLMDGGNAVDAAVATAFALAVVHPAAGNIGGGGFLLVRPSVGKAAVYDFRERAPMAASPTMFLVDGKYSDERHHDSHVAVGVPGTVAGLHLSWADGGRLPWKRLLAPAIAIAREGFMVSDGLSRSLRDVLPRMKRYPASVAQFSRDGAPYEMGDVLKQPDLARTLERIAERFSKGFYQGETAELIVKEMQAHGGLVTLEDLREYSVFRRPPLVGTYRGHEVLTVPPPSSGGVVLLECLNVLEGYDVGAMGFGSSRHVHTFAEALRRAFADRARWLGDPEGTPACRSSDWSRRRTRRRCAPRSPTRARRSRRRPRSSGPRATTRRTSRSSTPTATRSRSPTRSRTATARRSSCPAPASCSTTRWATSTPAPASRTRPASSAPSRTSRGPAAGCCRA